MSVALLYLVPSLLLIAALLLRRYPGERRLIAAATARRPHRVRRSSALSMPVRPRARLPRGGLLIATALAVRPPPRLLVTA